MRFAHSVVVFAAVWLGLPLHALALEPCRNPDALGVSRTVEVDTAGGAMFGSVQYPHAPAFLRDKEVVLTFDDGPFAETTPEVLDALAQECTKATFFYVGKMALKFPGVLAQVDLAGHTIAAHTWAHADLRKLPGARGQAEIEKGLSMLQARLGHPVAAFFRFPYLSDPDASIKYLNSRNIGVFSADVDSWDSHGLTPSSHIVNYVMMRLKLEGHGIVLMHDIKHTTAAALPEILKQLKAGGFKIVHMVSKSPATTLAPFDAWAAKMIQQHDAGVAMAKTDEPVMPVAGDSAPAGKAKTVVVAAAVPRAAEKPAARTVQPESATLASVVRLAVAASGAATTVRSAPKPAGGARTTEPVVVAAKKPEPVALAAEAPVPVGVAAKMPVSVVVATKTPAPFAVAARTPELVVAAAKKPEPAVAAAKTLDSAMAALANRAPELPVAVKTPAPPVVSSNAQVAVDKDRAAADAVKVASLDDRTPIMVPLPNPEARAVPPAAKPIHASQPPIVVSAPRKPVAAVAIPAPAPAWPRFQASAFPPVRLRGPGPGPTTAGPAPRVQIGPSRRSSRRCASNGLSPCPR